MRRHRVSVRQVHRLLDRKPLRLNLASGSRPKPGGWVNVDLFAAHADLRLDLREPLPFPENSASHIYCEHFFEHLEYPSLWDAMGKELDLPGLPSEALQFLRECRRVLLPGGILDIVVPDAERALVHYSRRHQGGFPIDSNWWGPKWVDTPIHRINYMFRQGREHKYAYDGETLMAIFASVGFEDVSRRDYDPSMDSPDHNMGSLFVMGRKPGAALHGSANGR
jgi:predicted SAM-dependent methyltransferase